ncbi:MAG: FCD domain-containing protein [Gemmatimonas sp.]|nr:FCD domain-containing protein [Gemmatimonas sp.]
MAERLARTRKRTQQQKGTGARWPQIEATTLADKVYQIVRNRVLRRELPPGTFIREQEVSHATGVSRTPVREALNRLASQDFLERVPHRGFRVPDRPWETLLDLYPIVTALEMLAGSLAFDKITPADLRRLKELNGSLERSGQEGDAKGGVEVNNAFHKVLSDRSGNPRLAELLDQLRSQVVLLDAWYFTVSDNVEASVAEHVEIIEAIERGNETALVEGLRLNYARARQALEKEVTRKNGASSE